MINVPRIYITYLKLRIVKNLPLNKGVGRMSITDLHQLVNLCQDGSVDIAPTAEAFYTGTEWQAVAVK
jgi:hypothetical protein